MLNFIKSLFKKDTSTKKDETLQEIELPKVKIFEKSSKYYKVSCLLTEIQEKGKLPIKIPPAVLDGLVMITKIQDWDTQLDDETIKNLNRIYDKWQLHLKNNSLKSKVVKVGDSGGFYVPPTDLDIEDDSENFDINTMVYTHDTITGEFELYENYNERNTNEDNIQT